MPLLRRYHGGNCPGAAPSRLAGRGGADGARGEAGESRAAVGPGTGLAERCCRNGAGRAGRAADRQRNRIERMFCRFKDFRQIVTRCDKLAVNFAAAVVLAAIIIWWA